MHGLRLLVITLAGIAACDAGADLAGPGGSPVRPSIDPSPTHTAGIVAVTPANAAGAGTPVATERLAAPLDFDGEIDALRTRFLPGFEAVAAAELARGLAVLAAISISSDRLGADRALAALRAALRDGAAGPADLEAARRTIDAMQFALEASPR
jgi:hypothetical protein